MVIQLDCIMVGEDMFDVVRQECVYSWCEGEMFSRSLVGQGNYIAFQPNVVNV